MICLSREGDVAVGDWDGFDQRLYRKVKLPSEGADALLPGVGGAQVVERQRMMGERGAGSFLKPSPLSQGC